MSYHEIWIRQWHSEIQLPVNPPEITFNMGQDNSSIKLERIGETTVIENQKPITFNFSSQFPSKWFLGCEYNNIYKPDYYINLLNKFKHDGTVRLLITNSIINLECTIEDFSISYKAGDLGTVYYDIGFKEYKAPTTYSATLENGKIVFPYVEERRIDGRIIPKTYMIKEGDYITRIAQEYLGDCSLWTEILKENPSLNNNYVLTPGLLITLPATKTGVSGRA